MLQAECLGERLELLEQIIVTDSPISTMHQLCSETHVGVVGTPACDLRLVMVVVVVVVVTVVVRVIFCSRKHNNNSRTTRMLSSRGVAAMGSH